MLEGASNKVGFLVVVLSACFWVMYITGFGLRYQQENVRGGNNTVVNTVVSSTYFSHWCLSVSGLPFYFLFLCHLMCGNIVTAVSALALTPLYLTSVGGVLNSDGNSLYSYYTATNPRDFQDYMWVEFGGALGSLILCWLTLVMWSCYSYSQYSVQKTRSRAGYSRLN